MSSINELISLLNKTEQRDFISHLAARNKRHDTRNIDLFKALKEGKEEKIKKEIGSNAYNVLKKRLNDRLLDFMAGATLDAEATTEVSIIKHLLLARKLFAYSKYRLAYKMLLKIEQEAEAINHFSLLNEIYHTMIENSHNELSPDQELVFKKLELNNSNFIEDERINMVYSIVRKAFKEAEHDSDPVNITELLKENYTRYKITDENGNNFKTLYQLAHIADINGAFTRDYHSVDLFFVDKIKEIQGGAGDTVKYLIYHIDLLYLVANIYFRKQMFKESIAYLEDMFVQMQRHDLKFYNERLVRYTTLMALNLNFTREFKKAGNLLDELFQLKQYNSDDFLSAKLARVMIHFQQGELDAANKIMVRFQRTDAWYERYIGLEWCLNMKFIEILLHIELGNEDYVDSRITSLVRKYGHYFKSNDRSQALPFLKLVKKYYHEPSIVKTEAFMELVQKTMNWKEKSEEDVLLMSFYAWLKSKMEGTSIYEATLELVNET